MPTEPTPEQLAAARTGVIAEFGRGMVMAAWAAHLPDHPAVLSEHGDLTFAELNGRINQLVRALRRRGLAAGDGVAVLCGNRPEFAEAAHAMRRAGLCFTPVNWHLTGAECGYIVDDCDARALIADVRFAEAAQEAAALAPRATVRLAVGGSIPGFEDYDAALAAEAPEDITDPSMGSMMLYTSGTTGKPKGVARETPTGAQLAAAAAHPLLALSGYRAGRSVNLATGPLYHSAPLSFSLMIPHMFGAAVALMERWDAEGMLRLIERYRVTHAHMVPTMFHRLLSLPDDVRLGHDLSSLEFVIHGAAPCPVHVKRRLIEWLGPIVSEYYAATEGVGTVVDSQTWLARPGTVGKPAEPGHIKVLDDAGNELPPGAVGKVYIRAGEGQRFNYHKDQGKTRDAFRGEHFTLGDVGYLDEDGYLFLTDRSTELIISGGVNIYPAEVEAVLLRSPHVRDVAVIGVPNPEWGEEVKAVVELHGGGSGSPALSAELDTLCRGHLARYKCPRSYDFVPQLPRSDSGKLYKQRLRERYRLQTPAQTPDT